LRSQQSGNLSQNRFCFPQHFDIPKACHSESLPLKPLRSLRVIVNRLSMLPSVDFYNQFCFQANKINNISPEWVLTVKSAAADLFATKMCP
jgi:hypothetical protein